MPECMVSDRGTAFTSKLCNKNIVKPIIDAVRTPRANERAKRANRIILSMLLPSIDDEKRWADKLRQIQWSINTMPNKTTGCTIPAALWIHTTRHPAYSTPSGTSTQG